LIVTEKRLKVREHGELRDLAPTALALLGFAKPLQMSGGNLADAT
jgi:bisphosphoglycerate-independent phosphoglycerate mutase (AlkP superfamily)